MIAFLFVYRCFTAMPRFEEHSGQLANRGVPAPGAALCAGLAMMLLGGLSVLLDIYAAVGASVLIAFTILANLLYHDFWNREDNWPERNRALYTFCNNIAVIGGLILVATS